MVQNVDEESKAAAGRSFGGGGSPLAVGGGFVAASPTFLRPYPAVSPPPLPGALGRLPLAPSSGFSAAGADGAVASRPSLLMAEVCETMSRMRSAGAGHFDSPL